MNVLIYLSIACVLFSCTQRNPQRINSTVTQFPIDEMLTSEVVRVPPIIITPTFMFITGNHLVIQNNKKDTLFDIFSYPDIHYQFSAGTRGKGPKDFPEFLSGPTQIPNGFALFLVDYKKYCEIEIDDNNKELNRIKEQRFQFAENDDIINGLFPLKRDEFIYLSDFEDDMEFKKLNTRTNEIISFSPYPQWVSKESAGGEINISLYLKVSTAKPDGKRFASFYVKFKRWRLFNDNGDLLREVSVDTPPLNTEGTKSLEPYFYYSSYPFPTDKYIYAFCRNVKSGSADKESNELQIWDWNGNPIAVYHLDQYITSFTVDEKAKTLFGVNNNEGSEGKIFKYSLPFLE